MEPEKIIEWGGYLIILILVFAETGLLLGLILPGGETLVFTAGVLVSTGTLSVSITVMLLSLIGVAFVGDMLGYTIGRKMGRRLLEKEDTWYFKKKYLHMVSDFIKKHKRRSLIVGKFLPVIRPFTPVMSGIGKQPVASFIPLTFVACVIYMSTFALGGYFLGNQFPGIKSWIPWLLPVSIGISLAIFAFQVRNMRKEQQRAID